MQPLLRILIVEDNDADAALLARALATTSLGRFEVKRVHSLAEALKHLAGADHPDAVVLDLELPDRSGLDMISEVQRASPEAAIVILTHHDNEQLALEGVRHGAEDFITKSRLGRRESDHSEIARAVRHAVERKRIEERLKRSEARLAESQAMARLGSWEWDILTNDVIWSAELRHVFGVDDPSFKPSYQTYINLLPPDERDRASAFIKQAVISKRPLNFEHRLVRPDGSVRYIHCHGRIIVDSLGQAVRMIGTAQDITERKDAESARIHLVAERIARRTAESAQQRATRLAEAGAVLGSSLDYEGTLETIGERIARWVGDACVISLLTENEETLLTVAVHDTQPGAAHHLNEVTRGERPLDTTPAGRVARTGEPLLQARVTPEWARSAMDARFHPYLEAHPIASYLAVALRTHGRTIGVISVSRHRADQPYTQEDLAFLQALADRAALAIENARLYQRAQEAIRARDEFLSIASHELRTPLSALVLQLAGIKRIQQRDLPHPTVLGKLEKAVKQTDRLTKLIESLLEVSKIAAGRLRLEFEEFELTDAAREVCERFADEAARVGCRIEVHAEDQVIGNWDRLRIDQIITNLISNAIKYGPGKPVEVFVEAGEHRARIEVRDQGIGIAPIDVSRIFGRFERAVSARQYGGLGLGLYITRQIVEAHGGSIQVSSTPGSGTTFVVDLPRQPAPTSAAAVQ